MKLLVKTNLINICLASIFLLLGGIMLYGMITSVINEEISEKLITNKERIVELIENDQPVESIPPIIEVERLMVATNERTNITDTVMKDPVSDDTELFRQVISYEKINNATYRITVRQIILEPHDYWNNIGLGLLLIWGSLTTGLLLIQWIVSKRTWKPFYQNLEILKKFNISDKNSAKFNTSSIKEFTELTKAIEELTDKVKTDYRSLKEFSENAAHELQTPLMIIQTKLEDVLQYPDLPEEVGEKVQASMASSNRLSKLIQTLLLIAKIENNQFDKKTDIDLANCIKTSLVELDDFIAVRKIYVTADLNSVSKLIDPLLADVLISNLLTNAIKHNIENGNIKIILSNTCLKVSNPSESVIDHPETMFDRFSKASQASSSHGLGLAIVKKICDQNNWKIIYTVENKFHSIEILF
jgi:two-component system OmpR family sensor kinase